MSDEKYKPGDVAKNIWLAGVGAYGRAVEEAQGRIEKAMEPPKLFRDLVQAGTALEEEARPGDRVQQAGRPEVALRPRPQRLHRNAPRRARGGSGVRLGAALRGH